MFVSKLSGIQSVLLNRKTFFIGLHIILFDTNKNQNECENLKEEESASSREKIFYNRSTFSAAF